MPRRPKDVDLGGGLVVDERNPRDYAREMAPLLRPYVKDEAVEVPDDPSPDETDDLDLPDESTLFEDTEPDELPRRPPPKRSPRHLTVAEFGQLVAAAATVAERLPGSTTERAVTLFLGEWLPKFKAAAHEGDEGVLQDGMLTSWARGTVQARK